MTGENLETAAQTEEEELASALEGYNSKARIEEIPAEEVESEQAEEAAIEEVAPALSLEDELKALKEKVHGMAESSDPAAVRKLHGEIGNINRTLLTLQSANTAETAPAEQAAALVLKRLSTEYPELAQPLAEDISEAIQSAMAKAGHTGDISSIVSAEVKQIRQADAIEALADEHPDYESVRETPAFKAWIATKDAAYQERFYTTWNPAIVSRNLTEFKTQQTAQSNTREKKHTRLAAAITPQGTNQPGKSSTLPDEEGLNVGYYGNRKRR